MGKEYQKKPQENKGEQFISAVLLIIGAIIMGVLIFCGIHMIQKRNEAVKQTEEHVKMAAIKETPDVSENQKKPAATQTAVPETEAKAEQTISRTPVKVKGIYVTGPRAGSTKAMNSLIDLVDSTELNAMVIDIKNDSGEITYKMDNEMVQKIGAATPYIHDISGLIKRLKEKHIYLIARVVAFKDPLLAEKMPELSLKTKNGKYFRDKSGLRWVNPYKKEVWDYLVSIGAEAAALGFDEIQFDYIRFSTDKGIKNVDFGKAAENKTKEQVITEFTQYAYDKLSKLGVFVSADVFGTIIDSETDAKIVGQDYEKMANQLDYICPMIYPSHYADGSYGVSHPDTNPYEIIYNALDHSKTALNTLDSSEHKVIVRPWLQDFTASWLEYYKHYGKSEIRAQIKAVEDAGYEEWILWNGSNNYTKAGLLKK